MQTLERAADDYRRVEQALLFLEAEFPRRPDLKEMARSVGLSEFHFQKMFGRWVGISPKRFLQFLSREYAATALLDSHSLLDAAFESGLSGPGRLHDLFVSCDAVTPAEYRSGGRGLVIDYGFHPTPFGECLLGLTGRGVCSLFFEPGPRPGKDAGPYAADGDRSVRRAFLVEELRAGWPAAELRHDPQTTAPVVERIFAPSLALRDERAPLHLMLSGTNFQIKVWEALLRIPAGEIVSYEDIAKSIGSPKAVRAVAGAVARNPISYVIPCHRVIRKLGVMNDYRWGSARKKALLGWEAARREPRADAAV